MSRCRTAIPIPLFTLQWTANFTNEDSNNPFKQNYAPDLYEMQKGIFPVLKFVLPAYFNDELKSWNRLIELQKLCDCTLYSSFGKSYDQ